MNNYRTPGVYIEEVNAFPGSIVEVETAVPAFVGYTEKASRNGQSIANIPTRIASFEEYIHFFGKGNPVKFSTDLEIVGPRYLLFDSMKLFYANGGGACFIVSVGDYNTEIDQDVLLSALKKDGPLEKEVEPTMLLIPDSLSLEKQSCYNVYQQMISHCKSMQNRVALFDIHDGYKQETMREDITSFREGIGSEALDYGVVYYPWVNGSVVQSSEVSFENFKNGILDLVPFASALIDDEKNRVLALFNHIFPKTLPSGKIAVEEESLETAQKAEVVKQEAFDKIAASHLILKDTFKESGQKLGEGKVALKTAEEKLKSLTDQGAEDKVIKEADKEFKAAEKAIGDLEKAVKSSQEAIEKDAPSYKKALEELRTTSAVTLKAKQDFEIFKMKTFVPLHKGLLINSPTYKQAIDEMTRLMNVLPTGASLAGVYTKVDNNRGVWKAPANISLNSVVAPTVNITHDQQENMNVDALTGKSVNAIRAFRGLGTLIWGARTLDGNSLDWRYVNVRRTMIMLEQSIKMALRGFVFEPNTASTWITVQAMISNFLTEVWKKGGLAGAVPEDAYEVNVGLSSTMTALDILEGKMIISIKVAISRPAEFIILRFEQQMQKS